MSTPASRRSLWVIAAVAAAVAVTAAIVVIASRSCATSAGSRVAPRDPARRVARLSPVKAAAATVRVRVRTADGAPAAGASCIAGPPTATDPDSVPAGADGVVTVAGVPPGAVDVSCGRPAGSTSGRALHGEATITVAAGATADLDLTLAPVSTGGR